MNKPKIIKHVLLTIEMEKEVDDLTTLMADRVFGIDGKSPMSDVTASVVPDGSLVIDDKAMVLYMVLGQNRLRPTDPVKARDWYTTREGESARRTDLNAEQLALTQEVEDLAGQMFPGMTFREIFALAASQKPSSATGIEVTHLSPADLDAEARRMCADMSFVLPTPSPVMLSTAQEKLSLGLPLSSQPTLDVTGV